MLLLMILLFDLLGKLKLERDFSRYNYLGLDSARVNGVDDAANFRTVRVRRSRGWLCRVLSYGPWSVCPRRAGLGGTPFLSAGTLHGGIEHVCTGKHGYS